MQLVPIITALRARCPTLGQNVAGAAEFKSLQESVSLPLPFAFVIPLDDSPQENRSSNSIRQAMTDSFAVVVAVSNVADEKGQAGANSIHLMRAELWAALLGWRPELRYNGIDYEGGSLLSVDRARLWYQFEFGAQMEIEPSDGYQNTGLAALPHLDGITIRVDTAADGIIDHEIKIPKAGVFP